MASKLSLIILSIPFQSWCVFLRRNVRLQQILPLKHDDLHCTARKRRTDVATRCVLRAVNTSKRRLRPQTPLGELIALPRPNSWIWGSGQGQMETPKMDSEWKGRERKGEGEDEWNLRAIWGGEIGDREEECNEMAN